jgi:hemoglobin
VNRKYASILLLLGLTIAGCGSSGSSGNRRYFTSGSRDADQRADQRMARSEQLSGQGNTDKSNESLYQRLGGDPGIAKIVDDFVTRAMVDPRVNWTRQGVTTGYIRRKSMTWNATPENVAMLKKHMAQFLALATGGPSVYQGKQIQGTHAGMKITNAEFDAAIGDLKATLDKFQITNQDQKDLLSIVESTRVQVVEKR